jgi:hypothetical protein
MENLIRKKFTQVPNDLIDDNELHPIARFIFVWLCSKPDGWKYYNSTLNKSLNLSDDTRRKYMKELGGKGWITKIQKRGANGEWCENDIQLNPYPIFSETVPYGKISDTDKNGIGKTTEHNNTNDLSNTNLNSNTDSRGDATLFPTEEIPPIKKPTRKRKIVTDDSETLFKNSEAFSIEYMEGKLAEEKGLGVDLDYYFNSVKDWNAKKRIKRTPEGWVATMRTFMRKDHDDKKLKFVDGREQPSQNKDEELAYLNI